MQEYSTKRVQYPAVYDDTYSAGVVVLPPSPTTLEGEPAPQNIQAALIIVVSANFAVMTTVIIILLFSGVPPLPTILGGIGYYMLTTPLYTAMVTGVITTMYSRREREKTERIRIEAWREIAEHGFEWRLAVEQTRQLELMGRRGGAHPAQRVSPLNSFVPAIEAGEEAQQEAVRFAMGLYATNGKPDPKKLHPDGRLAGRMIGSKRGAGSRDAGRWLLKERIIERVSGGYRLRIDSYPTRDSLKHLL